MWWNHFIVEICTNRRKWIQFRWKMDVFSCDTDGKCRRNFRVFLLPKNRHSPFVKNKVPLRFLKFWPKQQRGFNACWGVDDTSPLRSQISVSACVCFLSVFGHSIHFSSQGTAFEFGGAKFSQGRSDWTLRCVRCESRVAPHVFKLSNPILMNFSNQFFLYHHF